MRPRPDTLENNSVCMSMKTKDIAIQNIVFSKRPPPHQHPFNGPFSGTTQVSRYQKGKNQSGFY